MKLGQAMDNARQFEEMARQAEQELFDADYPALVSFDLFGRTWNLRPFALCVVAALVCGLALFLYTSRRARLKSGTFSTLAVLALPLGLVCAHVFYVLTGWNWYASIGFSHALCPWEGGYALWGGMLGCGAAALLTARLTRQRPSALLDACAAPVALTVALVCFAAYPFSGERLGRLVEFDTFLARFPLAVQDEAGDWYWAVFVMEGAFALLTAVLLLFSRRDHGDKARLFMILYCSAQIVFESLHKDDGKMLWYEFIRVPQLTAALVLAALFTAGVIRRSRTPARLSGPRFAELLILLLHGLALVIGMEFAKDKLPELPNWACYAIMADGSFMFGYAVYRAALLPLPRRPRGKEAP